MKVSPPTTIRVLQMGIATRAVTGGGGPHHNLRDSVSQPGRGQPTASSKSRSSDRIAGARTRPRSPRRARRAPSGGARRARGSPPCWPRRGRAGDSRSWPGRVLGAADPGDAEVGRMGAPVGGATRASGRTLASASVIEGTSETTLLAGLGQSTGWPRSSWLTRCGGTGRPPRRRPR